MTEVKTLIDEIMAVNGFTPDDATYDVDDDVYRAWFKHERAEDPAVVVVSRTELINNQTESQKVALAAARCRNAVLTWCNNHSIPRHEFGV